MREPTDAGEPELDAGLDDAGMMTDAGAADAGAGDAGIDAGRPVEDPEPWASSSAFGFGIASGDATAERVLLATRYDGAEALRLMVWRMDGARYADLAADAQVTPGDGGFVQLDVSGLSAGAQYRYAFVEQSTPRRRSVLGRFRAALGAGQFEPLVFGASCCTSTGAANPLLQAGRRDDLAAFLLLGDTSYNDGATTLAAFRTAWHRSLSREAYRALRASTSVIASWDDHEVDNNFNPETIDPALLAAARQSFLESLPIRVDAAAPQKLWRSFRYGDSVEVIALDVRGERKPSTRNSTQELLSTAQLEWLKSTLETSPCRIKLVMTSVPMTDFGFSAFTGDAWRAYQRQRLEVLSFIESRALRGVLWVSGDHHFASLGKVSPNGVGANALEVLVGPASQSANPVHRLLGRPRWDFASGENNYVALHCRPEQYEVRVVFHDGQNAVLHDSTLRL